MLISYSGEQYRLPDFLIIGAARSGTTSLYYLLRQHDQIFMPDMKEPFFFTFMGKDPGFELPDFLRQPWNLARYSSLFDLAGNDQLLGEASTTYLYLHGQTIKNLETVYGDRIESLVPFAILRNPVDRTLSNYMLLRVNGWDDLSFDEYLEAYADEARCRRRWDYDWIGLGTYGPGVRAYQKRFPKFRVYLHEDLQQPQDLLADALRTLNLPDEEHTRTRTIRANAGGTPRSSVAFRAYTTLARLGSPVRRVLPSAPAIRLVAARERVRRFLLNRPEISERQRNFLREIFRDDVENLQELLGRDLSGWLR